MSDSPKIVGAGPIIMVDDSSSDAYVARRCYENSSLDNEFVWLKSGEELLDLLENVKAGDSLMPAVVLLDINMPGIDGFEALANIRAEPDFREIPIITMLTNSNDPNDVKKSEELGANGYFTKPSDISDFIEFFDSLIP